MNKTEVGLVGAGGIATKLKSRLQALGVEVSFCIRRNHTGPSFQDLLCVHKPKAVFVAIATLDKGEAARDYIKACIDARVPVITCEKGSLAYHAGVLKPHLNQIGFSAAVGGGTMALRYMQMRSLKYVPVEIHAVINGTLNYIWDLMSRGVGLEEACDQARNLGYAEPAKPGASSPLDLVRGEIQDVMMKASVLFNVLFANGNIITPESFGSREFNLDDLRLISNEGSPCRLVVSFSNHPAPQSLPHLLRPFWLNRTDEWSVSGAFIHTGGQQHSYPWLPPGVGNVFHISEGALVEGRYTLDGPGAGDGPTTAAMINDYRMLCPQ